MADSENKPIYQPGTFDGDNEEFLIDFPDNSNGKKDKIILTENKQKRSIQLDKHDNNSGMGEQAPYSVSKEFNWGAFLFNFVWGIKYKKYALLLIPIFCFVKYGFIISLAMSFYAGIKGNQWAWEETQYKNEADFHKAQKTWVKTWGVLAGIVGIITLLLGVTIGNNPEEQNQSLVENYNPVYSLELPIPDEIYDLTDNQDLYADWLTGDKYIIYWLRAKNRLTQKNRNYIQKQFNENKDALGGKFILHPDVKGIDDANVNFVDMKLQADCVNSTCIADWLYERCNNGYCIINPSQRKYIKVRTKEGIIPKAIMLTKKWSK